MRQGYRVIDVDTHVTPSAEVLFRYADKELLDRQAEMKPYERRMKPTPGRGHPEEDYTIWRINPYPYERVAGQKEGIKPQAQGAGTRGALEGRVDNLAKKPVHVNVQHDNPHGRLADLDVEGVDIDLILPSTWACGSSALEPKLAQGLYRAYHRYMADYCGADSRRLKGLVLAPANDPTWAAKTIRELAPEPWVAAVWPIIPEGVPVDDPDLAPIWEAMNETNLPYCHHSFFYEPPYFPGYRDIWGNTVVARTAAHVWGAERLLAYILVSGMLDKYPNLRVGTVETGHGWLPNWILRLSSQAKFVKDVLPERKSTPLEYVQQGRVFCGIENHEGPLMTKAVNDILGDGVLMYQSDYPHPESLFPAAVDTVLEWKGVLGEPATRKLMGENAMRFLRLASTPWDNQPQAAAPVQVAAGTRVEFEKALEYVLRARAIAKERGLNVSVAVHDTAGHPVAVARGKSWHGPYMAMGKARLASAFRKPTAQLLEQWKDRPLFPMSLTSVLPGEITLNPGGYPIFENGEFVGAIGVGGGSPAQDDAIARLASGWSEPTEGQDA